MNLIHNKSAKPPAPAEEKLRLQVIPQITISPIVNHKIIYTMNLSITNSRGTNLTTNNTIKKVIFLIEDDRVVSKMLETILKHRDYKVHQFFNGNDALDAIANMSPPDLVLLDIVLPYVDGYKILETMCANDDWKGVPKVMITSNSNEANVVRAFEIGADDYITKPIQIEELIVRVNRLLR